MIKEYGESPFCRAAQTFAEALPRRADVSVEDMVNVVIPEALREALWGQAPGDFLTRKPSAL